MADEYKVLERLFAQNDVFVVHYACESFKKEHGKRPSISAIAIKKFNTTQSYFFSPDKTGEGCCYASKEEAVSRWDEFEAKMLREFCEFVCKYPNATWVHWNMRNESYGFDAIALRFLALTKEPLSLNIINKLDLAALFADIYGNDYIEHPRLERLMRKNNIADLDFMSGVEEAEAFERKAFNAIRLSVLRKVEVIDIFLRLARDGKLMTNSRPSPRPSPNQEEKINRLQQAAEKCAAELKRQKEPTSKKNVVAKLADLPEGMGQTPERIARLIRKTWE